MANEVVYLNQNTWQFTAYPSAARTATPDTMEYHDFGPFCGLIVVVDVTAIGAAPSVVFKIQGYDPVSAKTWDILTSAAVVATGTTVLKVFPGITTSANVAVSDVIPENFRIIATHGNSDSITYSAAAYPVMT